MRVALVEKDVLEHVVGPGECLVHVAELEGLEAVDVALLAVFVDARLGRGERLLGIGDGLERLVRDIDEIERLERSLLVACDDGRDRVADVAYALGGERVFILSHRKPADEKLADVYTVDGTLVLFGVCRSHQKIAGGYASKVWSDRSDHRESFCGV